jgi:hypothetical protein
VTNDLCVTPHDTDRRALDGLRLCPSCRDRLESSIRALAGLHAELEDALSPRGGGGQRVTGSSSEPLPINPAVVAHRDQIRHDLVWWCVYVADARGLGLPGNQVPEVAGWLANHAEWLAGDLVAAEECLPVMRALVGRAHGLLDPDRRLATGERCRVVPEGGERCAGVISMVQGADETWTARCSVCGLQEAASYLHDSLAGRLVTIERVETFVLRQYGRRVAPATIRSWAARGHVKTTTSDDRTWYDLASVQKYLGKRTAGRERMAG